MAYRVVLFAVLCLVARSGSAAQDIAVWQRFSTAGHPKSNGVELTMRFPSGWMATEGEVGRVLGIRRATPSQAFRVDDRQAGRSDLHSIYRRTA